MRSSLHGSCISLRSPDSNFFRYWFPVFTTTSHQVTQTINLWRGTCQSFCMIIGKRPGICFCFIIKMLPWIRSNGAVTQDSSVYSHHSSARATSGCSKSWSPGTTPELFLSNWKTKSTQYELGIMAGGVYTPVAHALNRTPRLKNGLFRRTRQAWLDQEEPSHALSTPNDGRLFGEATTQTHALRHRPCVNINMHEAGRTEAHRGWRKRRRDISERKAAEERLQRDRLLH